MQIADAIIIDEASMLNKLVFETINNSLKDVRNNDSLMGGIPILCCGDFRQILPVIPKGTRAAIV